MNVLHNQTTMEEIFFNMFQLDGQLRQTIFNLFDSSINVHHNYQGTKCNPFKLKEVTEDICRLLSFMESLPKTDSDMDIIFVTVHCVKDTQIRLHQQYYIKHDFEGNVNSESKQVPIVKEEVTPAKKRIEFDFKFLTGKELKQKYIELKKHFINIQ